MRFWDSEIFTVKVKIIKVYFYRLNFKRKYLENGWFLRKNFRKKGFANYRETVQRIDFILPKNQYFSSYIFLKLTKLMCVQLFLVFSDNFLTIFGHTTLHTNLNILTKKVDEDLWSLAFDQKLNGD